MNNYVGKILVWRLQGGCKRGLGKAAEQDEEQGRADENVNGKGEAGQGW